jgi:hypothetical protein
MLPLPVQALLALALAAALHALLKLLLVSPARDTPFLKADEWRALPLAERTQLTHNTVLLR